MSRFPYRAHAMTVSSGRGPQPKRQIQYSGIESASATSGSTSGCDAIRTKDRRGVPTVSASPRADAALFICLQAKSALAGARRFAEKHHRCAESGAVTSQGYRLAQRLATRR